MDDSKEEKESRKLAAVETLYTTNSRDVLATLRVIADNIEKGEYGEVTEMALVLYGSQFHLFGAGHQQDAGSTAVLFAAGHHKMVKAIVDIHE